MLYWDLRIHARVHLCLNDKLLFSAAEPIPGVDNPDRLTTDSDDDSQFTSSDTDMTYTSSAANVDVLDDDDENTHFLDCLPWVIVAVAALTVTSALSVCLLYKLFLTRRQRNTATTHASTQMDNDNFSVTTTSEAPAYEEVMSAHPEIQRYVTMPHMRTEAGDNIYEELFPLYESLGNYREHYLALHGYTYLQLAQHARNDVTRREIARSVGPVYLTLLDQYETRPKAYEATQVRLQALVQEAWREKAGVKQNENDLRKMHVK